MDDKNKARAMALATELEVVANLIFDKQWTVIEARYGCMGVKLMAAEIYSILKNDER